jgi:hypothetical protein
MKRQWVETTRPRFDTGKIFDSERSKWFTSGRSVDPRWTRTVACMWTNRILSQRQSTCDLARDAGMDVTAEVTLTLTRHRKTGSSSSAQLNIAPVLFSAPQESPDPGARIPLISASVARNQGARTGRHGVRCKPGSCCAQHRQGLSHIWEARRKPSASMETGPSPCVDQYYELSRCFRSSFRNLRLLHKSFLRLTATAEHIVLILLGWFRKLSPQCIIAMLQWSMLRFYKMNRSIASALVDCSTSCHVNKFRITAC